MTVALALALASTSPQLDSTAGRSPQTARRSHEAADRKHSEVRLPTDARDEPDGLLRDDIMLRMWHNAWAIGNTDTCNVCDGLDKELEDIDSHGNAFLTAANVTVTTATKFVNADSSASSLGAEALTTNIDIRDVVLKTSSSKGDSISCQGVPVLQAEDDTDLAPPSGSFATSDDVCLLPTTKAKALLADDACSIHGDAASGAQAHATPETWKVIDATVTLTILRALSLLTGDRTLTSFNHQALWSAAHPCGRQGGCFSHFPLTPSLCMSVRCNHFLRALRMYALSCVVFELEWTDSGAVTNSTTRTHTLQQTAAPQSMIVSSVEVSRRDMYCTCRGDLFPPTTRLPTPLPTCPPFLFLSLCSSPCPVCAVSAHNVSVLRLFPRLHR